MGRYQMEILGLNISDPHSFPSNEEIKKIEKAAEIIEKKHKKKEQDKGNNPRKSRMQSININKSGRREKSMTTRQYERMLRKRELVKEKFRDYIINEDGYNNLGYPGYKLYEKY